MPGAGTDKTKNWIETPGPVIILVEPQLGENIGAAARAMANFGLGRLRLVKPRDGWPNLHAQRSASGADRILDEAVLFDDAARRPLPTAPSFWRRRRARTTRPSPCSARTRPRALLAPHVAGGRERRPSCSGASAMGSRTTRSRSPTASSRFRSIRRLPRSTWPRRSLLVAYEWFKLATAGALPFAMPRPVGRRPASNSCRPSSPISSANWMTVEFFRPPDKRDTMLINLRNIFTRMQPTQQDIQTLHGVIMAIAEGRKGPGARRRARRRGGHGCCARCWPSTPRRGCRTSADRCAGWRGCCAATRPTPSARCGRR